MSSRQLASVRGSRSFRAAGAQQLCSTNPHEAPHDSPPALVQCLATRGFVVGVAVGIPRWHARGQGFKSPQLHHHKSAGQRLALPFSGASWRYSVARFVPPACHSMLAAASRPGSMRPRSAHPGRRRRWRRPGRPSRAGSAAPPPRTSAPSGPSAPGCSPPGRDRQGGRGMPQVVEAKPFRPTARVAGRHTRHAGMQCGSLRRSVVISRATYCQGSSHRQHRSKRNGRLWACSQRFCVA